MLGTQIRNNIDTRVGEVLCEATQSAYRAALPYIGCHDKNGADKAAVDAFQDILEYNSSFTCTVVMGEGDKDKAPMLAHDDVLGQNRFRLYDLAVDPIDGTTFVAENQPGGIAVAALASPGNFMKWANIHYMQKLVVGPSVSELIENGEVNIQQDPKENMRRIACHLGKAASDLVIVALDRPRNSAIIEAANSLGAKLKLIKGGDIVPALLTSLYDEDNLIDMLYSSGGAPEAVLAAAGVALRGGNMQARWDPQTSEEKNKVEAMGKNGFIFGLNELVGKDELHFAMTSITGYEDLMVGRSREFSEFWKPGQTLYMSRVNGVKYMNHISVAA